MDDRIRQTIDEILARDEAIFVWGVGTHTLRLLSTSRLKDAKIAAFVDSNPRYQGKTLSARRSWLPKPCATGRSRS